jgi:hypothetical protein
MVSLFVASSSRYSSICELGQELNHRLVRA